MHKPSISRLLSTSHLGEWEYRKIPSENEVMDGFSEMDLRDDFDARTVKSVSSVGTSVSRRMSATTPPPLPISTPNKIGLRDRSTDSSVVSTMSKVSSTSGVASKVSKASNTTASSATPRLRLTNTNLSSTTRKPDSTPTRSTAKSSSNAPKQIQQSPPNMLPTATGGTGPIASPLSGAVHSRFPLRHLPESDPHLHPTITPAPASALSVYILAHRYRLDELEGLAKDQILSKLTHETCMPML